MRGGRTRRAPDARPAADEPDQIEPDQIEPDQIEPDQVESDQAEPDQSSRDRAVDGVRAYAIGGVILGHWLVTALVLQSDGVLTTASPLATMPALTPVTWLCQTLGLFFFTAGYGSGRSLGRHAAGPATYRHWLRRRLGRLVPGATLLLGCTAVVFATADALGAPPITRQTVATLLVSPLWFLVPFVALVALTGPLRQLLARHGPGPIALLAVTAVVTGDLLGRAHPTFATGWRTPVALAAVWLLPYLIGLVVAGGGLTGQRSGWGLALGGAAGMATLVLLVGYPASAVGVPGAGWSNLNPPSLFTVCLAVAQIGVVLLLRPTLTRLLHRPRWWSPVRWLNHRAATGYLWHQPVLLAVTGLAAARAGAGSGDAIVPGLLTAPDDPAWLAARSAWLPVFAVALTCLLAVPGPAGAMGGRRSLDRAG